MSDTMMDEVSKAFNNFTNLMDKNVRGVQIGCYSVALVGLTIALRKVRPFSKFKRPKDIPNHFIEERRELCGVVKRIEPDGGILMIEHKPLVNLPIVSSGQLPVKISGVKVTGLGLSWLQAIVAGSEVKFVPVSKEKNYVQCEVLLVQPPLKGKNQPQLINVGENLLKIGFGQTQPIEKPLAEDPNFLTYYKRLQKAEDYAIRKQMGLKYYVKPTRTALAILAHKLNDFTRNLTHVSKKQVQKVPKLVSAVSKVTAA